MLEKLRHYLWKRRNNSLKRHDRLHRKRKHFLTRKKYDALLNDYRKLDSETNNESATISIVNVVLVGILVIIAVTLITESMNASLLQFAEALSITFNYPD